MPSSESVSPGESPRRSRSPERSTSLLVRNLDYRVKGDEIRDYFSKYGEVKDVYLPTDYYTRRPKGFAFVEFKNYNEAKEALERADGTEVLGSVVKIVFAREGRKTVIYT